MTSRGPRGARAYCLCSVCGQWVELQLAGYRPVDHGNCPAPYPPPSQTAVYDQSVHGQQPPDDAIVQQGLPDGRRNPEVSAHTAPDAPGRTARASRALRTPHVSRFARWAMTPMSDSDLADEFRERSTASLEELRRRLAQLPSEHLNSHARAKHAAIQRERARRDRERISNTVSRSLQQGIDRGSVPRSGVRFVSGGLPTLGRDR